MSVLVEKEVAHRKWEEKGVGAGAHLYGDLIDRAIMRPSTTFFVGPIHYLVCVFLNNCLLVCENYMP
jgi:hypothetical protein